MKCNDWESKQIKPGLMTVNIHRNMFHKFSFQRKIGFQLPSGNLKRQQSVHMTFRSGWYRD